MTFSCPKNHKSNLHHSSKYSLTEHLVFCGEYKNSSLQKQPLSYFSTLEFQKWSQQYLKLSSIFDDTLYILCTDYTDIIEKHWNRNDILLPVYFNLASWCNNPWQQMAIARNITSVIYIRMGIISAVYGPVVLPISSQ